LIDDVITTGSTLREISTLLLENGSGEVYAFSLLKA
jgi:predicted amidophosphoribosyltransferase